MLLLALMLVFLENQFSCQEAMRIVLAFLCLHYVCVMHIKSRCWALLWGW